MMKKLLFTITSVIVFTIAEPLMARQNTLSTWSLDVGLRGFKYSATGKPSEIGYNPVFERWEDINQDRQNYTTSSYQALEPLYFNFNVGLDVFVRFKQYFLVKLGYDYSNPAGIGGTGHIDYVDNATGASIKERKEFSYTSHQVNLFFGPLVPVAERAEIYLALAPMAPTWVSYKESYSREQNGVTIADYEKTFTGFFGSCRVLVGIQIRAWKNLKLGSEVVFALYNFMPLHSGSLNDNSFQFPMMKWNFTVRYELF